MSDFTINPFLFDSGVIISGLVMHLDAGDSASYGGSGQLWSDLTGSNFDWDLGATSSSEGSDPTFNGTAGNLSSNEYFSFDGGDRFELNGSGAGSILRKMHRTDTPFTFEIWKYVTGGGQTFSTINATFDKGCLIDGSTNMRLGGYNADNVFTGTSSSSSGNLNAWNQLAVAAQPDGTVGGHFVINGASAGTVTHTSNWTTGESTEVPTLGAFFGGSAAVPSGTRYAIVRIYDRILSVNELIQNWSTQKGRFGL